MLTIAGLALAGASPAAAQLTKFSPNDKAFAYTTKSNTLVSVWQQKSGYSHADYYRKASSGTQRHLWNKSGVNTTVTSGSGSALFKMRVCEWVKDNDDICSGWDTE
ncbi:hypothetical protein [Streptomyces poonensis]|uniref:Secreted protein n=1 Tax=Streptomyces poonensis TaxID=68255 RepID=A0A918UPE9_9ACTN|nr:hypothetical protein [Streptomyces poonensis]GGZ24665.1 hypothetical protein GCM10010365_51250 [Streptomyces poonensis]GLJ90011.1 hypothetical protein GCM10017589_26120 [Streptomyces poonensis]